MIKKIGSGFRVVSKRGKNLGEAASKEAAEKRLQEVEYFKHKKSGNKASRSKRA